MEMCGNEAIQLFLVSWSHVITNHKLQQTHSSPQQTNSAFMCKTYHWV